jgi:hypothetical protein
MTKRVTFMEVWIEPKGVWAGILRMLGYLPARRRGLWAFTMANRPDVLEAQQNLSQILRQHVEK